MPWKKWKLQKAFSNEEACEEIKKNSESQSDRIESMFSYKLYPPKYYCIY